jgi:hypothetical protein
MRKFLGTLTILVIIIVGVGVVRGWFSFSTDSEAEKTRIGVTIDKDKLKADTERLKEGVRDLSSNLRAGTEGEESSSEVPAEGTNSDGSSILPPDF